MRTRQCNAARTWRTIGLVDPNSPKLPGHYASLVDEVSSSLNPCVNGSPAVFLDGTPMTHDTRFSARFVNYPGFLRAAVAYDFIPLDWPGYLPTLPARIEYLARLARLKKFDLFFPLSEFTARRLSELLGIPRERMHVTGASVRNSLYELKKRHLLAESNVKSPYFAIVIASDSRKNPEVAVEALRRLNNTYPGRISLRVAGHYDAAYKQNLLSLAGHAEGEGFLDFCPDVSDEDLVSLLSGAVGTIVPSHMEGFSLPIVEAALCGCPAIASSCAAHLELIGRREALFQSNDPIALCQRLEAVLIDPALRTFLASSQAHLTGKFHEVEVGRRFWTALESAVESRSGRAAASKHRRPHLAFLTPYPPDQSGVAKYTAMTMRAAERFFDIDLYTDAPRPLAFEGAFRDSGPVTRAPLFHNRYNAIVSVIGNSPYHNGVFEFFERYGGPCILHDARLTQIYNLRLGRERFTQLATRIVGRPVSDDELNNWLNDIDPPSLFLEPIVERAAPLIVHTVTQQTAIKRRYGVNAQVIRSCPTVFFNDAELAASAREAIRERLGVARETFLVSTFGFIADVKGMYTCLFAIEILRSWNIPAELHYVGEGAFYKPTLEAIAAEYGIGPHVHIKGGFADEATYRNFLIASDAAIQLRTYGFGQFSAALADCISAGLPCAATTDLAESCDAPDYVLRVPDRFSPLLVAEQLALIWERRCGRETNRRSRAAYLEIHNFGYYARSLLDVLGIA
jgi:glycosyltransferase involved in cell wall biosynthesis